MGIKLRGETLLWHHGNVTTDAPKERLCRSYPRNGQAMQTLLTTTTEAAASLQFEKRPDRAKCTPSTLVQTLVYGWLANPTATVERLAQMAHQEPDPHSV